MEGCPTVDVVLNFCLGFALAGLCCQPVLTDRVRRGDTATTALRSRLFWGCFVAAMLLAQIPAVVDSALH